MKDITTTPDAAKHLGYTLQHTRLLIRQGKLKASKLGRDWVIEKEALQEFLKQKLKTSSADN